jgi:hypothetical protein
MSELDTRRDSTCSVEGVVSLGYDSFLRRVNGPRDNMRLPLVLIFSLSTLALIGCSHPDSTANLNAAASQTAQSGNHPAELGGANSAANSSNAGTLPGPSGQRTPQGTATSPSSEESSGPDTSALDAKIKQAEAKAKARNATEADRKAAAAAYLERANVYYSAQIPSLYKYALGDFRHVLKYDPSNEEAKAKSEQIISIYKQMGRPVPENGLEP